MSARHRCPLPHPQDHLVPFTPHPPFCSICTSQLSHRGALASFLLSTVSAREAFPSILHALYVSHPLPILFPTLARSPPDPDRTRARARAHHSRIRWNAEAEEQELRCMDLYTPCLSQTLTASLTRPPARGCAA